MGTLLFAAVALSCHASDQTAAKPQSIATFRLSIVRTAGVVGTPATDSVVVDSGQTVSYALTSAAGYLPLTVLLDGQPVATAGSIMMDRPHTLAAGASPLPRGSAAESTVALAARSVISSADPVTSTQELIATLEPMLRASSNADSAVSRIRALAYDKQIDREQLVALDAKLAGHVFTRPAAAASHTVSRSNASEPTVGVPLTIVFVNGVHVDATKWVTDWALFDNLIGSTDDIPHDPTTVVGVGGFYVPTQGFGPPVCMWDAVQIAEETNPDWITIAANFNKCGDLTLATQDLGNILEGGNPTADATGLAGFLRSELNGGRAVILVGHSRGTLVAQAAHDLLLADPIAPLDPARCVGFVSVASPLWTQRGWGDLLSTGIIAKGQPSQDLMYVAVPQGQKAQPVANTATDHWDLLLGPLSANQTAILTLVADYLIHGWDQYVGSQPTAAMIRSGVKTEAAVLQRTCAPAITLSPSTLAFSTTPGGAVSGKAIGITNGGTRTLDNLSASVSYAPGSPSGWLTATLSSTVAPATLMVIPDTKGLGPGIYASTVSVTSSADAVTNSPQTVVVTLTIAAVPVIGLSPSSVSFAAVAGGPAPTPQAVTVSNTGAGSLTGLTATVSYPNGAPTGWLSAQLSGSTAPATILLGATPGSLSQGNYNANVVITSTAPGIVNSPQTLPITLAVTPAVAGVQVSPSNSTIAVGATTQLAATGVDAQGNAIAIGKVTWTSGNASVASVTGEGLVTGVNPGSATITASASGHSGTASITVTQTTPAPPPALAPPAITAPGSASAPGPTLTTLTPTFTWTAVSGSSGYGLYIRDLTTNQLVYPNVSGTVTTPLTGTSFVLSSGILVNNHQYRWAMTSFNGPTESTAQSAVLYFVAPTPAPPPALAPPAITAPGSVSAPGPTLATLTPTFSWSAVSGASGYGLYIRDLTTNQLVYPNASGTVTTPLTGTSFVLSSGILVNDHQYRWAMTSFNGPTESTAQSAVLYFVAPAPAPPPALAPPTITAPGNASAPGPTLSTLTPTFSWSAVSGASGYGLYIRDLTTNQLVYPNANGTVTTPLTGTSFVLSSGILVNNHQYRWAMTSFNGATESAAQSAVLYFQTGLPAPLAPPVLTGPGSATPPGPIIASFTPTFSWQPVSGATSYGFYLTDLTTLAFDTGAVAGPTFQLTQSFLLPSHTYSWSMTTRNGAQESARSGPLYFQSPQATGPFKVDVRFVTGPGNQTPSASQNTAIQNAAARIARIVTAKLGPVPIIEPAGSCGANLPAINETVEDLVIFVSLQHIDGPVSQTGGNILGLGGPCFIRSGSLHTIIGIVEIDADDLPLIEQRGQLEAVALHEMIHVLGFGNLWGPSFFNLLVNPSLPNSPGVDTYMSGASAIGGFDEIGGALYTGHKVPVENTAQIFADTHWRTSVLGNELMNPFINAGKSYPLSRLTLRSLQDLGYSIDLSQADPFVFATSIVSGNVQAPTAGAIDDRVRIPISVVDALGRTIRRIAP